MKKKVLLVALSLLSYYSFTQIQLDYTFRFSFMNDIELIKKNRIREIVVETIFKDEVEKTTDSHNSHYVFDDLGRLVMEFKGESFTNGKLLPGEYALNFSYANASSNLPTKILCYRNENDQLVKYTGEYQYDEWSNLIKYTSSQGNTVKILSYKNGKKFAVHVKSDEKSLQSKYKYEYPNENTVEIHRWGINPNDVSETETEKFQLFVIQEFNTNKQLIKEIYNPLIGMNNVDEYIYEGNRLITEMSRISNDVLTSKAVYTYDNDNLPIQLRRTNFVFYTDTIESIDEITFKYNHR